MGQSICAKCGGDRGASSNVAYCKSCYNEYKRAWYIRHREAEIARSLAYNQANPDKHRKHSRDSWHAGGNETHREWIRLNPDKVQTINNQQKAKRRGAEIVGRGVTHHDWKAIKENYSFLCGYCGLRKPLTMDHRVPVCRGGKHEPENIIPACGLCNSIKRHRTEEEYRTILGGATQ